MNLKAVTITAAILGTLYVIISIANLIQNIIINWAIYQNNFLWLIQSIGGVIAWCGLTVFLFVLNSKQK